MDAVDAMDVMVQWWVIYLILAFPFMVGNTDLPGPNTPLLRVQAFPQEIGWPSQMLQKRKAHGMISSYSSYQLSVFSVPSLKLLIFVKT